MNHDDLIEVLRKAEKPCIYLLVGTTICFCVLVETLGYGKTPLWFTGGIVVSFASWYFARGRKATKNRKQKTENNNQETQEKV